MDYEPLDLTPFCNAGPELFGPGSLTTDASEPAEIAQPVPTGLQILRGLPFRIGSGEPGSPSFIALGAAEGLSHAPVSIPVGMTARHILFAHALLETELWRGGQLGIVVARYCFEFEDGQKVEVPIRERFEIGNVPLPWGQHPFLCVTDTYPQLEARYSGPWGMTGRRQVEATDPVLKAYFIWVWRNPRPEQVIRSIQLVPLGPKVVVAAVTLGHLQEYPVAREARQHVRIDLLRDEDASKPFDLDIQVDRGTATYAYPLPAVPIDTANPQMPGFGSPRAQSSSPAYVEISAIPSATVTVKHGAIQVGQVNWGTVASKGPVKTKELRVELVDSAKNWVRVLVLDDETNQPIPCRIAFHSRDGIPYAPHGHHAPVFSNLDTWHVDVGGDVCLGQISYAYINGECQGWLPRGEVLVDVARGYEYEPLRTPVAIGSGQEQLTLRLKRIATMNKDRWFSGDTHVHFLSSIGAHLEADAEGLNVVNLLQSQWAHLFTSTEEFTGRPNIAESGRTIVFASQENRQHVLGHLSLLGLTSPVMPWCTGGPSEAEMGGGLETTLSRWADAAHSQGGTVILPHFPKPNCEAAALVATGRVDGVEMIELLNWEHKEYYRYLNGGYRLPLVGGTDKMDSSTPVGLYRTYVYIPPEEDFTYANWCGGLRAGRTFVSGGALINLTVEGKPIGSMVEVSPGSRVEVEAQAHSIFPLFTLQIVQNGKMVAETAEADGAKVLTLRTSIKIDSDGWLAARCAGPSFAPMLHYDTRRRGIMAHTSPIYITCGKEYQVLDTEVTRYMLTLIEGGLSYIRELSPQEAATGVTHHHGRDDHNAYLEEPFLEAQASIERRLREMGKAS